MEDIRIDISHPPVDLEADDHPSQDATLQTALRLRIALAGAQEDQFNQTRSRIRPLEYYRQLYLTKDKNAAIALLSSRNEINIVRCDATDEPNDDEISWTIEGSYVDLQICVGNALGLGAMIPNLRVYHGMEFKLMLHQRARQFRAKHAKLGFDPTGCMLWIGRASNGEDAWLAWVPEDQEEDVPPGKGTEDTTLSQKHHRIATMFIAHVLKKIRHRDTYIREKYPDWDCDEDYRFATNVT